MIRLILSVCIVCGAASAYEFNQFTTGYGVALTCNAAIGAYIRRHPEPNMPTVAERAIYCGLLAGFVGGVGEFMSRTHQASGIWSAAAGGATAGLFYYVWEW